MTARRDPLVAIGLVAGLLVCVGWSVVGPATAMAQDREDAAAASLNPLAGVSKAKLTGFLEAPLFNPSRRAPSVAPPPVVMAPPPPLAAPPEPPPTLHLLGVIQGVTDVAIVHRDEGQKTIILHTGDHVGSWSVTVLPTVGMRLRSGDRSFDYALFAKPGAVAGPVPTDPALTLLDRETSRMDERNARLQRRTY